MKKSILILIAAVGLFSCKQANKSSPEAVETETPNSVRKYEYTDSKGKRLIIQNGGPKGGQKYAAPNGEEYVYAVFWTRISNETDTPLELMLDFPVVVNEFPTSPRRYFKLLIPSDTLTLEKENLFNYGLNLESFLNDNLDKPSSLKRIINSKESSAFYIVTLFNQGVNGTLRTRLSLKGQNLFYKISAYKNIPGHPLMSEKEMNVGSINLKNLTLQK